MSSGAVNTSRVGGTTVLDRGIIDPGSAGAGSKPKSVKAKRSGGVGAGSGSGGGGGVANPSSPTISENETLRITNLSPREEKEQQLRTKLAPSIFLIVERLRNKGKDTNKPGADEARFVRDEKAEVQIWLTEKSDETLAKLKGLGFEVVLDPKTAKLVIGRVPIENLEKLAYLKFVRYVAPQISR